MKLEICTNSFASAKIAMRCGIERIELCQNLELGGTTPSAGDIQNVVALKEEFNCKIYILIRPRTGNFCYVQEEIEVMQKDILFCRENGADGVVLGALNHNDEIDAEGLKQLLTVTGGMGLTFHRAFDLVKNTHQSIDQIVDFGFERILTSGQQKNAFIGKEGIRSYVEYANGRISIMPGSGINVTNAAELIKYTGVQEIHFSAREVIQENQNNKTGNLFEMDYWQTSEKKVRKMQKLLDSL